MTALLFLLGCAENAPAWTPPEGWEETDVAAPDVLATGLDGPVGLVAVGDTWLVAEYGGGRVLRVSSAGTEELTTGLEGPWGIAVDGARMVVTERDGGRVDLVEDGVATVIAEGLAMPGRVAVDEGVFGWIDEGTGADGALWVFDGSASATPLVTNLATPLGLAVADGTAWVCERGANRVVGVDLVDGALSVIAEIGQAPQDIVAFDGDVWFSAYTYSWPRGQAIYRADADGVVAMLTTPPYPGWIGATDGSVVWTGGGVIARGSIEGGEFETVVNETAVGALVVGAGTVVWTDSQRGEIRSVGL